MSGQTDLDVLLADMRPHLSESMFAFATVATLDDVPAEANIIGTFREEEGLTIVGAIDDGWQIAGDGGQWAMITLSVHSSLNAVGLTAAVTSALADQGISANVIAAYFHDHIFVQWDRRRLAMHILSGLGSSRA